MFAANKEEMKPRKIAIVACLVVMAGLYAGYWHMARQDMIRCTLEWGRLAPFPAGAREFTITTEGCLFTRAFRASFKAKPNIIAAWIKASPASRIASLSHPKPVSASTSSNRAAVRSTPRS